MLRSLVGSEMCIRDRYQRRVRGALKSLLRLAQGHLSQNATTQREDEELLADVGKEMPNNVRSAIILRHGEKRILNQFCAALKERMRQTIMFFSMNAQRNSSG
eukprot:TRINITY_DN1483_c0_g1_i5.p2 TRINITY_DN1483_c0_g1~~TRINITY_DN1483_c0_g1_i5.p2  ORF type:complete len:103 (+),score=28.39 TRINITY_DN1483_c0_g1_i5:166-474(+)